VTITAEENRNGGLLSKIGPLPKSDSGLMRRIRFHQAWYRSEIMGIDIFGQLFGSGKPCGSVLADRDSERMKNFVGHDAAQHYQFRRTQGWGVDPVRCTKYMTSSQTLTFNMLGQAVTRPELCADLFNSLLGRSDLVKLEKYDFEFSPAGTEYSLGDRTLIDLLLRFRTRDNALQVVGIETKLADRFSTRSTAAMGGELYRLIQEKFSVWHNMVEALADNRTRQLVRCHALAQSVQRHEDDKDLRTARMMILLHPDDRIGYVAASAYSSHLTDPAISPIITWDAFLACALATGAIDYKLVRQLSDRYIDILSSESAWSKFNSQISNHLES